MLPLHHDPENIVPGRAFQPGLQNRHLITSSPALLSILGREAAKNRDGRIRTGDLLLPRQADYQAFLHPGSVSIHSP